MKRTFAAAALLGLVFTLISLPASTVANAQDRAVTLTVEAGYDGYFRNGQWLPVLVSVSNSGADISGELRVSAPDALGQPSDSYATLIELPTQSSKQVYLYIPLTDQALQVRVELATADRIVASETRDMRLIRDSDMLFAVITESPRGGIDLKAIRSGVGDSYQANWRLENVPRTSEALRGLDALILTDADTGNLTTEQRESVRSWVLSGGHLIVTGGPNWQKTQAGVSDLIPMIPTSTTTLTSLPSVAVFSGKPGVTLAVPTGSPVVVAQGALTSDAMVLASQSNVPLIVRRSLGGGTVDYVAVDPGLEPFQSWADRGQFWFTLLTSSDPRPSWAGGLNGSENVTAAANQVTGLRLPDVIQLILFLTIYIAIIGPVNYLVLRQIGRREWAWFTIPVIVIATAVIYYVTGFNLRGTQATINRMALVQVWPDNDQAQVDGIIGVAAPRRGVYDLTLAEGFTLRALTQSSLGSMSAMKVYEGLNYRAQSFPVDAGTAAAFTVSGFTSATNIDGNAVIVLGEGSASATPTTTSNSARIEGIVRNTTGLTLRNVVVLALGGAFELGTLNPDDVRNFSMPIRADQSPPVSLGNKGISLFFPTNTRISRTRDNPDMTTRDIMGQDFSIGQTFVGRGLENNSEKQEMKRRQTFLQAIAQDNDPSGGRGTNVFVVGWTSTSPLDFELVGSPYTTEDSTMYVYQLPVSVRTTSSSGIAELPNAYVTWTPTERSSRRDASPYDLRMQPGEQLVFRYTPMPLMRMSEVSEIRLTLKPGNNLSAGKGTLSLWDWQANKWEEFTTTNFLTRIRQEQNPVRFVGPENAIEVMFDAGDASNVIYYERLDITLYGRLIQANQ